MAKVAKSAAAYLALVVLPFICLWSATPATAADDACNKPLHLITSLPMTAMGGGVVSIPISFNGVEKQFLLDTGGFITQVSSTVADTLKLPRLDSPMELYSVSGKVSKNYTKVKDFALGHLHAPEMEMQISPLSGFDGLFAPIGFKAYDFDMDFAGQKLNIMSNDHCDGKVVYWPAKALAVVPVNLSDAHVKVPVMVDGHRLTAIIDTGAGTSTMRLDIARYIFNLTPDSPDMKVVGHLDGDAKAAIYEHPFKTLSFEGVTVNNPQIEILTDIVSKNADHSLRTGSLVERVDEDLTLPEVIVGMDVLRKLHLYLAIQEKRLYLTEASTPAAPSP